MTNFKKETLNVLKENGKTIDDIIWIGCEEGYIPVEEFFNRADFLYDSGYGAQEVATNIMIVGDTFVMTRGEYDGSEWWDYRELVSKPSNRLKIYKLYGGMWDGLTENIKE